MAIRTFNPVTPSRRGTSTLDYSELTPRKKRPKKPSRLEFFLHRRMGRNNQGAITSYQRGGGHKRKYRVIDFQRDKLEIPAKVVSLEYDPNRTAFIALVRYEDGESRYILAPLNLKIGDKIQASDKADIQPGNCLSLESIPVGTLIHNIELESGKGGMLVRTAGSYAQLLAKDSLYCHVKMPSGEIRLIHRLCRATIGQLSNLDHENVAIGKAGRNRWKGWRPVVRGVAMNPIDHPMGGGEGKHAGGLPRSPWGQWAKGYKTRKNKRTTQFIVSRRKK